MISFEEYSHDMKETADHAAGIIGKLKKEIEQRDRLIWSFIKHNGGKLEVQEEWLIDDFQGEKMVAEYWPVNRAWVYRIEEK